MILHSCFDCKAKPSLGNQETIGDGKYRCNKCREAHFKGALHKIEVRRAQEDVNAALAFRDFMRGGK